MLKKRIKFYLQLFFGLVASLVFLISSVTVFADSGVPRIISYQGRLMNSSGDLLGGSGTTYYFKFSIWNNATVGSGTKLWPTGTPATTTATVRQGVFNVNIGDTANGYPEVLDYNFNTNSDIYLQVEVSSDNSSSQTLSPRQRISAASFAELAGAVSGSTTPSSFGTTTPIGSSVVTIEATSTNSVLATLRGFAGQVANLFQIQNSSGSNLFAITATGAISASSTATSTMAMGINISGGCFAVNGTCIGNVSGNQTPWTSNINGGGFSLTNVLNASTTRLSVTDTAYFGGTATTTISSTGLLTTPNLLVTGSTTLQNFTALNSTTTNSTSTSFFTSIISSTNEVNINSTSTTLFSSILQATSAIFTSLTATNATSTSLAVTGLSQLGTTTLANLTVTSTATSTFTGGIQTGTLSVTSTTASSTFANGINLSNGCFAINGTCLSTGGSQTPWTSNISGGGFSLTNVLNASTTRLSVTDTAYFGGTATTTINSAGLLTAPNILVTGSTTLQNFTSLAATTSNLNVSSLLKINSPALSLFTISTTTTGTPLLEAKNLSNGFGLAMNAGAFISRNSYIAEEFNSYRTTRSNAADFEGNQAASFGDSRGWGVYSSVTSCTYGEVTNGVNGRLRLQANTTNLGCMATMDETAGVVRQIMSAQNLPTILVKLQPSNVGANNVFFVGMASTTDGQTTDPSTFIGFTNNGGTTWSGQTANVVGSTTVACTGQTIDTNTFGLGMIEVRSQTDVHFFIDPDVSNGVQFTECGTGSQTNIPTGNLGLQATYQVRTGGTASTFMDIDFIRAWQDDNNYGGGTLVEDTNPYVLATTSSTNIVVTGTATSTFVGGISTLFTSSVGSTATTTIRGDNGTSTFAGGINLNSGCFAITGNCVISSSGVGNFTTLNVSGTSTLTDLLITGSSTFQNFTALNSTTTNSTSTSLFTSLFNATNGTFTNATSTSLFASILQATNSIFTNLLATNATSTSLSVTGLSQLGTTTATNLTVTGTATSTFTGGIQANALNITGNSTSTFNNGITLANGCFAINNICVLSASGNGSFSNISVTGSTTLQNFTAQNSTTTNSTTTNLFTSGTVTIGTLTGPLQAINGVVSATGTISTAFGGTGLNTYVAGDILYASAANTLSRLPIGGAGTVLKVSGGLPSWGTDLTSGGGSGSSPFATSSDNLSIVQNTTSQVVLFGTTATTTTGNIFEVLGNTKLGGNLLVTGSTTLQNFTFVSATGTNLTITGSLTFQGTGTSTLNNLSLTGLTNLGTTTMTNATSTTFFASLLSALDAIFTNATSTNFFATNITGTNSNITNATSTSLFASIFQATSGIFTSLIATNATSTSLSVTGLSQLGTTTVTNLTVTGTATSTFTGGIAANALNITGNSTSTFANGITLNDGCFAFRGVCIGSGSGSGTVNAGTQGQLVFYNTSGTAVSGTSSLYLAQSGNFNIGTSTDPGERLEVVGNIISKGTDWRIRDSAADKGWHSVAYGNGLYVAVGSGTNNLVMTSSDGINWTSRTTPANNAWQSVTYGNGLFVAVSNSGTGDRIMTSSNGINWTTRTNPVDNSWQSVTYGNGLFVAVSGSGTGDRIMTSPDGINWTTRNNPVDNGWSSVVYGNGLFVAVSQNSGASNQVMTSSDGISWSSVATSSNSQWQSVTYGNGLFVAVADFGTNRVMTSLDGTTWASRNAAKANEWQSVTYGNGLFVAVSYLNDTHDQVMTSPDGINWTLRYNPTDRNWEEVAYGNGTFVAVSSSGSGNRVMTSGKTDLNALAHNNTFQGGMSIFGNVGIGTSSPSATLSLVGSIFASTTATSTFYGGGINLVTASGNTGCFAVNGTCLSSSGGAGSFTTLSVSGLTTLSNLLVTGSSTFQNFTALNSTTSNATSTNFFSTNIYGTNSNITNSTSTSLFASILQATNSIFTNLLATNATSTNLAVTGLSQLGTTTVANLTVTGTATSTFTGGIQANALNITGNSTSTFANGITLQDGCFAFRSICLISATGTISLSGLTVSGATSLATLSASGLSTLSGGASTTNISIANNSWIGGNATTTSNGTFTTNGNVGIGTTSPYLPLSVAGNSAITGYLAVGTSPTTDLAPGDVWSNALRLSASSSISSSDSDITFLDDSTGPVTLTQLAAGAGGCSRGNAIISGGIVTYSGTGLIYDISPVTYCIGGLQYRIASSTQVTLSASDPSSDRIDVIVANISTSTAVVTGTPSSDPSAPGINASSQVALSFVLVGAGVTSQNPTTQIVYQENTGTEWTGSQSTPVGQVDFNSTVSPQQGSKNVEVTTALDNNDFFSFATTTTFNATGYQALTFYIQTKTYSYYYDKLEITLRDINGNRLGSAINLSYGSYGYYPYPYGYYTKVSIPLSDFGSFGTAIKSIRFTAQPVTASNMNFRMDNIKFEVATAPANSPSLITGSGSSGRVAFWNSTNTITNDASFVWNNTTHRLGIGTSTPYAALSVVGQVVASYFTATSTTATSTFANGINLVSNGCFAVNGICLASSGGSASFSNLTITGSTTLQNFTALNSTTTNSNISGTLTIDTLTGPLQAINGVVSATGTISTAFGGTGLNTYVTGDILYASGANTLSRLPIGSTGTVLKVTAGIPSWETDLTSGGGGGSSPFSTTTNNLAIIQNNTSQVLLIGTTATTTTGNILEVQGNTKLDGNLLVTGSTTLQNFTFQNATGTNLTVSGSLTFQGTGTSTFNNVSMTGLTILGTTTMTNATSTSFFTSILNATNSTFGNATSTNLAVTGTASTSQLFVSNGFYQSGFTDCSLETQTVLYNATTGKFTCGADATGGGSDANWTFFNGSGIYVSTTTNQVLIGASATTSLAKLEVIGNTYVSGNVGIGTTSPYARLSIAGEAVAALYTATTTGFRGPSGQVSAPTYSFSNDTDTGIFNEPSVILFSVDGLDKGRFNVNGFRLLDGTAVDPALANTSSGSQGIYFPTNSLAISVLNSEVARFTSTGLGIGTTSPSTALSIVGSIYASSTATSTFQGGGINLITSAGNTGCFAINGVCIASASGAGSFTTLNVSGLTTLSNLLLTGSTTLQNFTALNSTTSNSTSTNLFSTNIYGTNSNITNSTSTSFFTSLFNATNGTFTNATSTSFFASILQATSGIFTSLTSTNSTSTSLAVTGLSQLGTTTATNLTVTGTATSTFTGGIAANALNITGNSTSTFANGITLQDGCFAFRGVCIISAGGAGSFTNLLLSGSTTLQNFTALNSTTSNSTSTNLFSTNITGTNSNITNSTSTSLFASLLQATNSIFTNLLATNATSTSLSVTGLSQLGTTTATNLTVTGTATSTFTGGIAANALNITGNSTSTFANGITLQDGCFAFRGVCIVSASGAGSFTTLNVSGLTTLSNLLLTGSTTLQNFTALNSTTSNATSTNLFSTNIYGTNSNITNSTSTSFFTSLFNATNGTFTNATSSSFFASILQATNSIFTNLLATNATSTNLAVTGTATTSQLFVSNGVFQSGFTDCSAETQTVLYNATTGKFTCGVDATGGGASASSTAFSAFDAMFIGRTSTTTILGNGATSTFAGGVQTTALNVTSTTATSTFANGINLTGGCFAVNGVCVRGAGVSPSAYSFVDNDGTQTTVAANNTTNVWSLGTQPNISPTSTADVIMVSIAMSVTATGGDDEMDVFRVTRNIGADADCSTSGAVGSTFSSFTTNINEVGNAVITFMDSPATTNNVRYTICSSALTTVSGGGTVDNKVASTTVTLVAFTPSNQSSGVAGTGAINSGNTGRLAFYASGGTTLSETSSNLFWENLNGRLGIGGTTTPSATLSLVGSFYASTTATSTFQGGGINLTTAGGNTGCFAVNGACIGPGDGNQSIQFNNNGTFGGSTTLVWNNTNGRFGIGTTTPLRNLDVVGTIGGNTVASSTSLTTNTTQTVTTAASSYFLANNSGTTDSSVTTTFNITGLPDVDGTFAFVEIKAEKGITTNPRTQTVSLQVNGTSIVTIATASTTAANTQTKNFTLVRMNSVWKVIGVTGNGSGQLSSGSAVIKNKNVNEVVINNAVSQRDDDLYFNIGANETWSSFWAVQVSSSTSATPDFRFTIMAPSGAICDISYSILSAPSSGAAANGACGVDITGIPITTSSEEILFITANIKNGSTAGEVALFWAQNTSNAAQTQVMTGSFVQAFLSTGADLAETYYSKDTNIGSGDVVSLDSLIEAGVAKSTKAYDSGVVGVVTTMPGLVLGDGKWTEGTHPVHVALAGRVPVKVSIENGDIEAGDYLTSSSIPGVAMKATKAGAVIGQAMTAYDKEEVGQVTMFIKNSYFGGKQPDASSDIDLVAKDILAQLVQNSSSLMATTSAISFINTDRLIAGLEIITPRLTADTVAVNKIESASGGDITLNLDSNSGTSTLSKFIVANASSSLFRIDANGNAVLSGNFTADSISAKKISGLELITGSISSLESQVSGLATTTSNDLLIRFASGQVSIADLHVTNSLVIDGGLTVSGITTFASTTKFLANVIAGTDLSVAGFITAGSISTPGLTLLASTTESLVSTTESIIGRVGVLELRKTIDPSVLATLEQGLVVNGLTNLNGGLKVDQIGALGDSITLLNDVTFIGRPYLNSDSAGFAKIPKGARTVEVVFDREYLEQPVVTASITVDDGSTLDTELIFDQEVSLLITKKNTKGFTIKINKPAPEDISLNWTAFAVKNAKTFSGETPVLPIVNLSPDVSESLITPSSTESSVAPDVGEIVTTTPVESDTSTTTNSSDAITVPTSETVVVENPIIEEVPAPEPASTQEEQPTDTITP